LLFLTCKFNNTADIHVADGGDKFVFLKGNCRNLRFFRRSFSEYCDLKFFGSVLGVF